MTILHEGTCATCPSKIYLPELDDCTDELLVYCTLVETALARGWALVDHEWHCAACAGSSAQAHAS